MNELALFAGAGGGILGGQLLGWRTICAVERDAYAAAVLAQRQNDGLLDLFPIWSDITTFDGKPWKGIVDVVSGGFPCQDISVAGKGAGIEGERSGLWGEMERVISEIRPNFIFVESSPALTLRGLGRVLGDLASLGYDAEWGVLGASDVGAPHKRERIWIVGYTISDGWDTGRGNNRKHDRAVSSSDGEHTIKVADSDSDGRSGILREARQGKEGPQFREDSHGESAGDGRQGPSCEDMADTDSKKPPKSGPSWARRTKPCDGSISRERAYPYNWPTEPAVGRVVNGVEFRVDRLKALGNGQVPKCHAEAWSRLLDRININNQKINSRGQKNERIETASPEWQTSRSNWAQG